MAEVATPLAVTGVVTESFQDLPQPALAGEATQTSSTKNRSDHHLPGGWRRWACTR